MTVKSLFMLLLAGSVLSLSSCKDDDNGPSVNCDDVRDVYEEQSDRVNEAIDDFNNDPTEDTCEDLKDAIEEYLSVMEPYVDCNELDEDEKDALEEEMNYLEEVMDDLDCD